MFWSWRHGFKISPLYPFPRTNLKNRLVETLVQSNLLNSLSKLEWKEYDVSQVVSHDEREMNISMIGCPLSSNNTQYNSRAYLFKSRSQQLIYQIWFNAWIELNVVLAVPYSTILDKKITQLFVICHTKFYLREFKKNWRVITFNKEKDNISIYFVNINSTGETSQMQKVPDRLTEAEEIHSLVHLSMSSSRLMYLECS